MPRVKIGSAKRRKHKRLMKLARGFRGANSRRVNLAIQSVWRAGVFATESRRQRKRDFRAMWIVRITAACKMRGIRYSQFISAIGKAGVTLNRKMLSEVAIADPAAFDKLVEMAKAQVAAAA